MKSNIQVLIDEVEFANDKLTNLLILNKEEPTPEEAFLLQRAISLLIRDLSLHSAFQYVNSRKLLPRK